MSYEHEFSDDTKRGAGATDSLWKRYISLNKESDVMIAYKVKIRIQTFVSTGDSSVC